MGSMTSVSRKPRSTRPASSLRTFTSSLDPSTSWRMASSATLSMLDVGLPSAPMHSSIPRSNSSGRARRASRTLAAMLVSAVIIDRVSRRHDFMVVA